MYDSYKPGSLYVLEKDMPQLKAGVIFELRKPTAERGGPAYGYMTNIWVNGNCQDSWAGDTYTLPGQLSGNREWFTPVERVQVDEEIFDVNGCKFRRIQEEQK